MVVKFSLTGNKKIRALCIQWVLIQPLYDSNHFVGSVPLINMSSKGFTSESITYWQRMAGAATAGRNKARTCVATDSPLVLKNGSGSDDMRQHARAPCFVGNICAFGKRLIPRTAGNELCRRSKGSDHLRPLCNLGFFRRISICVGREGISRASQAREANVVGVDENAPKA